MKHYVTYDEYLGYCVMNDKKQIVFAGSIKDCNDRCVKLNTLNEMCFNCVKCGKSCKGTTCKTWTGCIYKKTK